MSLLSVPQKRAPQQKIVLDLGHTGTKFNLMENTKPELWDALKRPFPVSAIHWRVGATSKDKSKGIALAYVDARDVMKRLDDTVTPAGWQCEYPFPGCCKIGLYLNGSWVWKSNGAGATDVEGEKGQFSDSFKRAAVMWGISRYLYSLPNEWVPLDQYRRISQPPKLPKWATPEGFDEITKTNS